MIRCALSGDPIACAWGLLPMWAQYGIFACLALMLIGIGWRVFSIVKGLGGWPAAVGALGIIGIIIGVFWPRKVHNAKNQQGIWPDDDPVPTPIPRKKKRPTIFDR